MLSSQSIMTQLLLCDFYCFLLLLQAFWVDLMAGKRLSSSPGPTSPHWGQYAVCVVVSRVALDMIACQWDEEFPHWRARQQFRSSSSKFRFLTFLFFKFFHFYLFLTQGASSQGPIFCSCGRCCTCLLSFLCINFWHWGMLESDFFYSSKIELQFTISHVWFAIIWFPPHSFFLIATPTLWGEHIHLHSHKTCESFVFPANSTIPHRW